jgi:hypothetical protein
VSKRKLDDVNGYEFLNYQKIPKLLKQSSRQMYLKMYESCASGDVETFMACVYSNLDLNRIDKNKQNPFYIACWNGQSEILSKLLELNIKPNIDLELKPFFDSILKNNHHKIITELMKKNIDVEYLYPNYNLFLKACEMGRTDISINLVKLNSININNLCNFDIFNIDNIGNFCNLDVSDINNMKRPIDHAINYVDSKMVLGFKAAGLVLNNFSSNRYYSKKQIGGFSKNMETGKITINRDFTFALMSIFSYDLLEFYIKKHKYEFMIFEMNSRKWNAIKLLILGNSDEGSILNKLPKEIMLEIAKHFIIKYLSNETVDRYNKNKKNVQNEFKNLQLQLKF